MPSRSSQDDTGEGEREWAHRLEVEGHGLAALKLVDHLGAPGEAQEVQVGEPAPVDGLVLVAQQQPHKEQQHRHVRRQRRVRHVHVGRDRRDEVPDGCAAQADFDSLTDASQAGTKSAWGDHMFRVSAAPPERQVVQNSNNFNDMHPGSAFKLR